MALDTTSSHSDVQIEDIEVTEVDVVQVDISIVTPQNEFTENSEEQVIELA